MDPGLYERLFFLKCCMQADIRQFKWRQNGLRSLVLLLQLQPLPFNHANHNKWGYHEFTAGLWMLFDAMFLVRGHGRVLLQHHCSFALSKLMITMSRCVHMQSFTIYTSTTCQDKQTFPHQYLSNEQTLKA